MRYISLFLVFYCILLFSLKVFPEMVKEQDNLLIEVAIFPSGTTSESYFIQLTHEGFYRIQCGDRNSANSERVELLSVKSEKSKLINESDMESIHMLVNNVRRLNSIEKDYVTKGGWEVIIKTSNNMMHIYFNDINKYDDSIHKLIDKLIEVSPLEVNIHSWS